MMFSPVTSVDYNFKNCGSVPHLQQELAGGPGLTCASPACSATVKKENFGSVENWKVKNQFSLVYYVCMNCISLCKANKRSIYLYRTWRRSAKEYARQLCCVPEACTFRNDFAIFSRQLQFYTSVTQKVWGAAGLYGKVGYKGDKRLTCLYDLKVCRRLDKPQPKFPYIYFVKQ